MSDMKEQSEIDEENRKRLAETLSRFGCPESVCNAPIDQLMKCAACVSKAEFIKEQEVLLDFQGNYVRWENGKFVKVENGKLVVEHEGVQYKLQLFERRQCRDLMFVASDGQVNEALTKAFWKFRAKEKAKHRGVIDHWWESGYSMANRAMENMGINIVEYEPEISPNYCINGEMVLY